MHLSNELQIQLTSLNSSVKVGATIYGDFPEKYAFLHEGNRNFSIEFAGSENEFAIVLYEFRHEQKYSYCYARGLFSDIKRLANVVDLWAGQQKSAADIKHQFDELELFTDFEFRHPDPGIDLAWMKVTNMFFNDRSFWKKVEWGNRYLDFLAKAKQHKGFQTLYPFTTHYWLRFSVDKEIKETWPLYVYIVPTFYAEGVSEASGKYYVSYMDEPAVGKYFETAEQALDFYAEKLNETKAIRWVVK
jgi:hypothetical protein